MIWRSETIKNGEIRINYRHKIPAKFQPEINHKVHKIGQN